MVFIIHVTASVAVVLLEFCAKHATQDIFVMMAEINLVAEPVDIVEVDVAVAVVRFALLEAIVRITLRALRRHVLQALTVLQELLLQLLVLLEVTVLLVQLVQLHVQQVKLPLLEERVYQVAIAVLPATIVHLVQLQWVVQLANHHRLEHRLVSLAHQAHSAPEVLQYSFALLVNHLLLARVVAPLALLRVLTVQVALQFWVVQGVRQRWLEDLVARLVWQANTAAEEPRLRTVLRGKLQTAVPQFAITVLVDNPPLRGHLFAHDVPLAHIVPAVWQK